MAKGYCSLELYDTTTGNIDAYITSGSCSSYVDQIRSFGIDVFYAGFGAYSFADYLSIARGDSYTRIPTGSRLTDTTLYIQTPTFKTIFNDDWGASYQSGKIQSYSSGLSGKDAAQIVRIPQESTFKYRVYTDPHSALTGKVQFELFKTSGGNYPYENYESADAAWASYRLYPSGTTAYNGSGQRGVVSYAIEIADDVVTTNSGLFSTGDISTYPYLLTTGTDIRQTYLMYCIESNELDCETREIADVTICYTGVRTGVTYDNFISGVVERFQNSVLTTYDDNSSSLQYINSQELVNIFGFWSGRLEFNDWMSGDRFYFDLYPFNYTETYSKYFFDGPPIPTTGFYLQYPNDFTNASGLVNQLNDRLYSGSSGYISYPVWYDYPCLRGSGQTGAYFTGSLLKAEILTNNLVSFYSLRNLQSGYSIYLDLVPRDSPQIYTGLKYLTPDYVSLQGSYNNSDWFTLDAHSGVNWSGLEPRIVTVTGIFPSSGIDVIPTTGVEDEEFITITPEKSGEIISLYSFTQSGYQKIGEKCPPASFSRDIDIVYPSGTSCPTGGDEGGGESDKDDKSIKTGISGQIPPIYEYSFLRTGWNIYNPQNTTLAEFPYYDYEYYRIYLSNFNTHNSGQYIPSNQFVINNINLFYGKSGELPTFTGDSECIIGANYTVDIKGNVAIRITGDLTTNIDTHNSGVKCYDNSIVTGLISGLSAGDDIKFNIQSGKLTSSIGTGFLTTCVTGSGCFTSGINGWFYNNETKEVTTRKTFSGCTVGGSGVYSGNYTQLNQDVVNRELALGGFLSDAQFLTITTGASFTGFLLGSEFRTNLNGFFDLPITATGYSQSGYIIYSGCFTGNVPQLNYGTPTGYINSTGVIFYNTPVDFDYVSINNNQIFFNTDTTNYQSPNFYDSYSTLLSIINNNTNIYGVTGSGDGTDIYLTSLTSGLSGNLIELSASGSATSPLTLPIYKALSGGHDFYQQISGTGNYSGCTALTIPMTGFYVSNNGTGIITGIIPTFLGVREFSGLWNIVTGNQPFIENFRDNGWFYGDNYSGSVSGANLGVTPNNFRLFVNYDNVFDSPNFDVVKLNVWDTHNGITGSGVGFLLTGI